MIKGLKGLDADIILLQEVFEQLPSGINVSVELARKLNMKAYYVPAREKLRLKNGKQKLSHSGVAVLSKFKIKDVKVVELPSKKSDGQRLAQIVGFKHHGLQFKIANLHLTHLQDDVLRTKQFEKVLKKMSGDADIQIIGGDMNATLKSPAFAKLTDYQTTFPSKFPLLSSLNFDDDEACQDGVIDHIFVRSSLSERIKGKARFALDKRGKDSLSFPSDHKAVIVDLQFSE